MTTQQTDTETKLPVIIPELVKEESQAQAIAVTAESQELARRITNQLEYEQASAYVVNVINTRLAKLDELFDENIKRWYQGHKAAVAEKKALAKPFLDAKAAIDSAREAWVLESKRRQELEQAQLAASMTQAAEEQTALQAAELYEQGNSAEADALIESLQKGLVKPVSSPPPLVVRVPKADNTSVRMLKRYRLLDASKLHRDFLIPDEEKIGKLVRAMGKEAEKIVGEGAIEYYEQPNIASRR